VGHGHSPPIDSRRSSPVADLNGARGSLLRARWIRRSLALAAVATAALIVLFKPWHGPILVSLVANHGIDLGDLLVIPLLIVVGALIRQDLVQAKERWFPATVSAWGGGVATVALGSLLVLSQAVRWLDLDDRSDRLPYVLAVLILVAASWFGGELLTGNALSVHETRGGWVVLTSLLLSGLLIDALLTPSGTVVSAVLVAAWLALVVRSKVLSLALASGAAALSALTVLALTDVAGIDVLMANDQGGAARAAALGGLLIVLGVANWVEEWRAPSHTPASD
jgi:hypothetical protein